jgi:GTP-binding protein
MAPVDPDADPVRDALAIIEELRRYDAELARKPRWLIINKRDLMPDAEAEARAKAIVKALKFKGTVHLISAATQRGTRELAEAVMGFLEERRATAAAAAAEVARKAAVVVALPKPRVSAKERAAARLRAKAEALAAQVLAKAESEARAAAKLAAKAAERAAAKGATPARGAAGKAVGKAGAKAAKPRGRSKAQSSAKDRLKAKSKAQAKPKSKAKPKSPGGFKARIGSSRPRNSNKIRRGRA